VAGTVIASISITIGMWLERFVIVVPTVSNPRLPMDRGLYDPSWVEWSIFAGCFACFVLLYVLFTRFFPIVSIWELQEGRMHATGEILKAVQSYTPDSPAPANARGDAR
jgi:molybdopterin-containing oxidoreductase family membrane subunit